MTRDPSLCAICGGPNACAMGEAGGASKEPCWCVGERFPLNLLERVEERDRGRRCVCRACLEAARGESADE
jgi:hypothetical protein